MGDAAMNGDLEVMKCLYANQFEWCSTAAMAAATRNGHLDVVNMLETNHDGSLHNSDDAAAHGPLKLLKWLRVHRTERCILKTMEDDIGSGNLRVVRWLPT